ncbi:MAG: hypothetical protein KatS3mg051_0595 [Anaerolineae bacterium]|nr:MAG: hypothetical protein KatS3mg051_0595 [Anaerolineae bacterium]
MSHSELSVPLLDRLGRPFRDLRISVTDRCNFRCAYCMPEQVYGEHYRFLPKGDLLTFEEIVRVARLMIGLGARKIRLTGGEPLVRQQIERLVEQLATLDGLDDLAMTTNGYLLAEKAAALRDAGLHRVTVSLDSLDDEVFRRMNGGRSGVAPVLEGIAAAERVGLTPIKINTVVQRGVNDHTLLDLARYCREHGYIARFIEYMDVGNLNGWRREDVVPAAEIVERIDAVWPLEPIPSNYPGEVANRFRYPRRRRGDRRDRLGDAAVLRRLHAAAPVAGGTTLHLPVWSAWHRPARAAARRRDRCRTARTGRWRLAGADRSLFRIAGATGHAAHQGRDVSHRRLAK